MPHQRVALGDTAGGQWARMKDEKGGEMAMDLCSMVESRRKVARGLPQLAQARDRAHEANRK
jgi:hypothetical protein